KIRAELIFGTGGSVTFPVLMAGFFMRKKTALWEANTSLGLANKYLTPFVPQVFTVFPKVKSLSPQKQIWSAYPLRKQIRQKQKNSPNDLFPKDKFKIIVLGGSQGSVLLNKAVSQAIEETNWRKDIFIYHQTGARSLDWVREKYHSLEGVFAFPFSDSIQVYYKECDLIFSRAGSGSVAEMACFGKAVVLIPLTHSAGGHQLQNALSLSLQNCVEMIPERDFNSESFKSKILELKKDRGKRKQLAQSLQNIYQAEDRIADWLLSQLMKN
ncbi:MAG: glycosyltransferase, partial [Oligoflexia bacterium]|nr:glycosyltransferase [Oligoflexia bacterium]